MLKNRTPIRKEWFYLDGEKTKLNWFLLEIALEYYDRIMDSPELASYRAMYDNKQIALFCTYYARRAKDSLLRCLKGQRKSIMLYREHIDDFYPHHTKEMNKALVKVGNDAWDHMLAICDNCPQRCLVDYKSRSPEFDMYEDSAT
jgi:uncharacterized Fe-S radical SAM superfamily protein PflX